ncbi:MAG TPA: OB-fold domain-containing protein [Acidimicrobiales bacterium]|nr:OB-fold domain-containing protein [Acidimicrobiales bacterium]
MSAHLPIIDAESAPYWEGLGAGELRLKWCTACGRPHFFPRVYCPFCWGDTEWRVASGRGEVFATTVVRQMGFPPHRDRVPYNLAIVELAEGPHLLTKVVGVAPEAVHIGMAVQLAPELDGTVWMPFFRPAPS